VGPNYYQKLLRPSLLAEARRVLAQYTAEQIYSSRRVAIECEVRDALNAMTRGRYVTVDAFLIREVDLPLALRAAIEQKLVTEQQLFTKKYQLALTKATAEQKQIEAHGVADYNNTVKASLSTPLLEFERIQAMSQLARAPNAKTVVIGSRTGATPLLLESGK
jgi:regulator of protease activity HflC (stomatin/prohibitin superfamily)